ncbi:MAG: hypothetical protein ACR2MC_04195, partial [Actinomycetota bacterium]
MKGRDRVELVDLPAFGRRARLVWRKHRWACPNRACAQGRGPLRSRRSPRRGWCWPEFGGVGAKPLVVQSRSTGVVLHRLQSAVRGAGGALRNPDGG